MQQTPPIPCFPRHRRPRSGLCVLSLIIACFAAPIAAQDDALDLGGGVDVEVDPSLWVLDFKPIEVQSVTLLEGPQKGHVFWGLVYEIENKTGQDRDAYISISATSDGGKKYTDFYNADVEAALERKYGRQLFGKTDLRQLQEDREVGDVKFNYATFEAGKKKKCIAVFQKLDGGANHIRIQVRGLSNDLELIENDDGTRAIQERIYVLQYNRPGDRFNIALDEFVLQKKGWEKQTTRLRPAGEGS